MPLSARNRDPFSLSLGKRHHGENMVPGALRARGRRRTKISTLSTVTRARNRNVTTWPK